MIGWRCKCGELLRCLESGMPPSGCTTCEECGSTLGTGPNSHLEPEPHKIKTRYHPNTGKPYHVCANSGCFHREGYAEASTP